MLPKRVGVPKITASYSGNSSIFATGAFCPVLMPIFFCTSSGSVSGTRFTTASAPASRAPSASA